MERTSSIRQNTQLLPHALATSHARIPNQNHSTLEVKGSGSPCCRFITSLPQRFITFLKSIWYCLFPKKNPPPPQGIVADSALTELEQALENKPQPTFNIVKTEHTLFLIVQYGDKSTQVELKKMTKTEGEGIFKKNIEFWLLGTFDVSQFSVEVQKQIALSVRNGIRESGIHYLQYASSLKNFKSSLFQPYFQPSGYSSILTLKPNES